MSGDLFAAFSDPPALQNSTDFQTQISGLQPNPNNSDQWATTWPVSEVSEPPLLNDDFDDDDFGDFEDANASTTEKRDPTPIPVVEPKATSSHKKVPSPSPIRSPFSTSKVEPKNEKIGSHPFAGHMDFLYDDDEDDYDAGADDLNKDLSMDPGAAMAWSKRVIAEQQQQQGHFSSQRSKVPEQAPEPPPKDGPNKLRKKSAYVPPKDPNVLFDADDLSEPEASTLGKNADNDDDDFDDFQSFEPTQNVVAPAASIDKQPTHYPITSSFDLLSLEDPPGSQELSSTSGVPALKATEPRPEPKVLSNLVDDDGAVWDDFENAPHTTNTDLPSSLSTAADVDLSAFDSLQARSLISTASAFGNSNTLPPTNIPPPALVLSLFPPLFTTSQKALFEPFAKMPSAQRRSLLSEKRVQDFLHGLLITTTVLGHVIAGRKQRWKRDQILAQSMRIGASGKGGMKLTGLDRSEAAKEDREVFDVVRVWKQHIGRFKFVVSSVGSNGIKSDTGKWPSVPEIAEVMPVKSLKIGEGGIFAPHQCALCGLKREERVARVDVDIDDSFGEWWVEGTNMHNVCWKFWECQKGSLNQR